MLSRDQKIGDRYVIKKAIGEGGMANVYLAHDTILDRDVAIKVLRGDLENNDKFIRRFQREAKSASDLTHSNIVEVYDVGEEDGQHYIVMEYIDGKTLKQLVQKRGALTVEEVMDIMAQLTDGLSHAHDAYIIHRDIKPQNIMILDNGKIKITDFGIAMSLNATQLTQTNSVMGSVHYLPPEQANGKGATMKSDIYSSGILMYELLTGSVPFKGDNAVEIALKQLKEKIPSIRKQNPLIPQSVENIILKATAKNPKNRYDSIREMHEDIKHALDPENVNMSKYNYPYPESELDERRAIPIKNGGNIEVPKSSSIEIPKDDDLSEIRSKKVKKEKKHNVGMIVGIISAIVITGMIGVLVFMNSRNNIKVVKVPEVYDMSIEDAIELLEKKGFKYDIEVEASDEIEEGNVIKTKPGAGVSKKKGSIIVIVESSGLENVKLGDYNNQNAETLKLRLEKRGIKVRIDKKEVENPSEYIGKNDVVIDQMPKVSEEEEFVLEEGDELILYVPDILEDYPNMVDELWSLAMVEEFSNKYGLTMKVKDSKGNVVEDYNSYLDSIVISQNRTGKIASGVIFVVSIDVDTSKYKLNINYLDKDTNESVYDSKTEEKKDGESGSITCPGKAGYKLDKSTYEYKINGSDVTINCYYSKDKDTTNKEEENKTEEDNKENE